MIPCLLEITKDYFIGETSMYRVWIGKRESDILTYNDFNCSITFYGSNRNGNFAYSAQQRTVSSYNELFTNFVISTLQKIMLKHPSAEIHFYNNTFAYKIIQKYPSIEQHIVNLNSQKMLNFLNHKALSRLWLSNYVKSPAFCLLSKFACSFSNLTKKFGSYTAFVIQKNVSGGGSGTYALNKLNEEEILALLNDDDLYLVSPLYSPNLSVSCHSMIDSNNIVVLPVSEQVINTENCKLEYMGNRYFSNNLLISKKVHQEAMIICELLQQIGYRGICGFDFIEYNNDVMLIEINPRYQGSSYVLNQVLKEHSLPSLFSLNSLCFNGGLSNDIISKISSLEINYENRYIKYWSENDLYEAIKIIQNDKVGRIVFEDGLEHAKQIDKSSYLLRYLFLRI